MPKNSKVTSTYENNPFFVAGDGITLIFDLARNLGILLLIVSVLGFFGNSEPEDYNNFSDSINRTLQSWTVNDWLIALGTGLILGLAVAMVSALFGGVSSYASLQLAKGRKVSITEAFRVSFDNLWPFLWLQVIILVKTVLWTLLFIVPGIVMTFRYSLASTAFFDERKKLRGNAAVKESLKLTKGAWITTFSSNVLFNVLTLGIFSPLVTTAVNAVLYRQFDAIGTKKKPDAHWLSWVTLALPFVALFLAFVFFVTLLVGFILGSKTSL